MSYTFANNKITISNLTVEGQNYDFEIERSDNFPEDKNSAEIISNIEALFSAFLSTQKPNPIKLGEHVKIEYNLNPADKLNPDRVSVLSNSTPLDIGRPDLSPEHAKMLESARKIYELTGPSIPSGNPGTNPRSGAGRPSNSPPSQKPSIRLPDIDENSDDESLNTAQPNQSLAANPSLLSDSGILPVVEPLDTEIDEPLTYCAQASAALTNVPVEYYPFPQPSMPASTTSRFSVVDFSKREHRWRQNADKKMLHAASPKASIEEEALLNRSCEVVNDLVHEGMLPGHSPILSPNNSPKNCTSNETSLELSSNKNQIQDPPSIQQQPIKEDQTKELPIQSTAKRKKPIHKQQPVQLLRYRGITLHPEKDPKVVELKLEKLLRKCLKAID